LEADGQDEAALAAYESVFKEFGDSEHAPRAMLAAAQLHEKLGQPREVQDRLQQLVERYPGFPQLAAALYHLAWADMDLGQFEEAEAIFLRLAEQFAGTRYWADAVYRLAERAAQTEDYASAERWLDELLQSDCADDVRAHAIYLQGKVAADQQRWEDVLPPMRKLVEEFPGHALRAAGEYWVAEACYRLQHYDDAEQILARLDAEPEAQHEAWLAMVPLRRAQILAQRGQWDEAYELATGIAERFPDFRQQYEVDYLLGRCLSSQARFSEARDAYERVVRSPAGGSSESAAMAQWMIGETYFHQQAYDQAIRAYHRVESLYGFPKWQAAALLQAAKCHELKGERTAALRLYAQVVKDYPESEYAAQASQRLSLIHI